MTRDLTLLPVCLLVSLLALSGSMQSVQAEQRADTADFDREITPLLKKYCVRCHGAKEPRGDFDLTRFSDEQEVRAAREQWRHALEVVRANEMPPEEPLPTRAQRRLLVDWMEDVTRIDWSKVKTPGHVTIPRLTREEYNNTMRDLLGVDLRPGDRLSVDGEGNSGFTNDRDALFVTPSMMEKYFEAAERALETLIALRNEPMRLHLEAEDMFMTETKETPKPHGEDFFGYVINRGQMTLYESVEFPADGWYEFRIRARSTAGPTGTRLRINDVTQGDIVVPPQTPAEYTLRTYVERGSHQMAWNIQKPSRERIRKELEKLRRKAEQRRGDKEKDDSADVNAGAQTAADETSREVAPEQGQKKKYTKLPPNAGQIVNREAPKNYPRYPATGDEPEKIAKLIKAVDRAAQSVQRPYEWLRLHGENGEPSQLDRFTGYIEDRTRKLEQAKDALAEALNETREQLDRRYNEANAERLQDNRYLLERVADTVKKYREQQKKKKKAQKEKPGSVHIDWAEVTGPFALESRMPGSATGRSATGRSAESANAASGHPDEAGRSRPGSVVFIVEPSGQLSETEAARRIIAEFVRRAFRRPAQQSDVDRYYSLYQHAADRGDGFEDSLRLALTGVLVSPKFLFRPELGPGDQEFRLDDYQLASRLSYFLWLSMPDEELFDLAAKGTLSEPDVLRQQVDRMLADPKAEAFGKAFTGQWLGTAALGGSVMPDQKKFPNFSQDLAEAMKRETTLHFLSILREKRSVQELIDSNETWLNADLAGHYQIRNFGELAADTGKTASGSERRGHAKNGEFVRVSLPNPTRGGLMGMGSVLTATSSPTRTSPVIRGKWVLETLLGRTLPEPPADAGELPGDAGEARTLREELLRHRRNPTCASCHDRIDPIGFGLENFDATGRFRTKHAGKPIDAKGELPGGITFDGPVELKRFLVKERRVEFTRNVAKRLLSFALGRELQYFDEPAIEKMLDATKSDGFNSRVLLEQIVLSYPFQYQTGRVPSEMVNEQQ